MEGHIADLWRGAFSTVAAVGAPFICAALVVGLLTSVLQAATQLQENILSFAPKLAVVGAVLALAGPWLLSQLTRYCGASMVTLVEIARSGR